MIDQADKIVAVYDMLSGDYRSRKDVCDNVKNAIKSHNASPSYRSCDTCAFRGARTSFSVCDACVVYDAFGNRNQWTNPLTLMQPAMGTTFTALDLDEPAPDAQEPDTDPLDTIIVVTFDDGLVL